MNPADAQLIELIRQITRGGSRLLVTLARRGKVIERDDPERAAYLLEAVTTHPLYKGGRLTFDMLEIEDLMLDGPPVEPMSTHEVMQVLSAGANLTLNLADTLKRMGSPAQNGGIPLKASPHDATLLDGSVRVGARSPDEESADEAIEAVPLPRLKLGPESDEPNTTPASMAAIEGPETRESDSELLASDYLYDYVVLGLLDSASGTRAFQS